MKRLGFLIALALATPALALPPLATVKPINDGLRAVMIADQIRIACPSIAARMIAGWSFIRSLEAQALRSLEVGRSGLGGDGKPWRIGQDVYGDRDILPREVITQKLSVPNAERVFFLRHALRAGFTIDEWNICSR